jgi:hypothetical protein
MGQWQVKEVGAAKLAQFFRGEEHLAQCQGRRSRAEFLCFSYVATDV